MAVYRHRLYNRPAFKRRMRPAWGDHRLIYQNGAFHTAKEKEQKCRRPRNNIRERDLETTGHTGQHNL
jgi:hypothetical protein